MTPSHAVWHFISVQLPITKHWVTSSKVMLMHKVVSSVFCWTVTC